MPSEFLDSLPLVVLFLLMVISLTVALEGGYRLGRWRHARQPDEKEQPVGAIVASILGLLALLLGFTFSMAASRFEARRLAVLEEANAIGTTYLRARFLLPPHRQEVEALLREYVEVRLHGVASKLHEGELDRSLAIQNELWDCAGVAMQQDADAISVGLFVQSLNELIDLHAKRLMVGTRNRIPLVIWLGVMGLAIVGMAAVGYQSGLSGTSRSPAMIALVLSFALVLNLINDLDRGQEGLLRVSQQALIDVQQSIKAPT